MTGDGSIERIELDGPVAVIGDIHGSDDLLGRLLPELGDLPVLVTGDVCDRGPDTREAIDCCWPATPVACAATTRTGSWRGSRAAGSTPSPWTRARASGVRWAA